MKPEILKEEYDALTDEQKAFYAEKDGKYMLDVLALAKEVAGISGLKKNYEKQYEELKTAKAKAKEYEDAKAAAQKAAEEKEFEAKSQKATAGMAELAALRKKIEDAGIDPDDPAASEPRPRQISACPCAGTVASSGRRGWARFGCECPIK